MAAIIMMLINNCLKFNFNFYIKIGRGLEMEEECIFNVGIIKNSACFFTNLAHAKSFLINRDSIGVKDGKR
ncbi:hypothetical protein [Pelosinus baikalensis]|uniref:Uncharacterized protein n=1 Tax=Pelosinus baikalensis TaxID=2892015 RepID=A0ABS8HWE1_9FIRM|nr:hypothetical protein [Pelosinus baikalensis]MCC5467262.1 hypothetical protein [Pelosinus baikalensis]